MLGDFAESRQCAKIPIYLPSSSVSPSLSLLSLSTREARRSVEEAVPPKDNRGAHALRERSKLLKYFLKTKNSQVRIRNQSYLNYL
jgi:hypothetical protein